MLDCFDPNRELVLRLAGPETRQARTRVDGERRDMLNYDKAEIRYEPYPRAVLRPALSSAVYDELTSNYPEIDLFAALPKFPYKLSLSEKFAPANYARFIRRNRPWREFHAWVKSDQFIRATLQFLARHHVDVPVDDAFEGAAAKLKRFARSLRRGRLPRPALRLRTRFEFSVLKADGGEVAPHTDHPCKFITLVLSMCQPGEWDPAYGGGLDINRATDERYAFNWKDQIVPWDRVEVLDTVPFVPNQCIVFVKTFNSLHSVLPMTQTGSAALRKTVTIVIERDE